MPSIRVVTDSACDLPDGLLGELDISMVPLRVRFGAEELIDREELSTKEFWARNARGGALPETSAPSPGAFRQMFDHLAGEGASGVVCVALSSRLSATIEAARQAVSETGAQVPVRVIDSRSVTMGQGLVVVEAAERAAAGADLDEVVAVAERSVSELKVFGVIDTLENMRRGGRIGNAAAMLGSVLAIKPVIEIRDGVVEVESKQRTRAKSLRYLADKVRSAGTVRRLAIFGGDASDLDVLLDLLADVTPTHPLLIGDIGPVIGTHAGPGAVGAAWLPG